jgi:hypothetical protein
LSQSEAAVSHFQLFVLSYLHIQELSKYDLGLTHHPTYRDTPYQMSLTQLTIISPASVTPRTEAKVKADLLSLIRDNKIKISKRMSNKDSINDRAANIYEDDAFAITIDGRLFIKHYLAAGLSHLSSNIEEYHKTVDKQGFSDEFKKDFNEFLDKLKGRSQDAAVDIIIDIAKSAPRFLIPIISLVINVFDPGMNSNLNQPTS